MLKLKTCLFLLFVHVSSFAATTIPANDNGFLYTGRVDFAIAKSPFISWPGTSIKANFTGNELSVTFDDEQGKNYFNIVINGQYQFPYVLALQKGKKKYNLSSLLVNNSKKVNSLEIFKRTEGHEGGSFFHGLTLANGHGLVNKPKPLARKIAYFGDSITSGMGNEAVDNEKDNVGSHKNHYWSYAAISARQVNAEFHTTSLSGIGLMKSYFDFIMPEYWNQLSAVGNNNTVWDFSQWQADVVVINLGQNDYGLIERNHKLIPEPSAKDIVAAYKHFYHQLAAVYPKAKFIFALGSMRAVAKQAQWPVYIKTAVNELNAENKQANIQFLPFNYTGYGAHPRVHQHINNAEKLTATIKTLMQW